MKGTQDMSKKENLEKNTSQSPKRATRKYTIRWMLVIYDIICFLIVDLFFLLMYGGFGRLDLPDLLIQSALALSCIIIARFASNIYIQIWRYGGIQSYIRLMMSDGIGCLLYISIELLLPIEKISFSGMLSLCCMNLLLAMAIRMTYRYAYKCNRTSKLGKILAVLVKVLTGRTITDDKQIILDANKTKIAIVGAGRVGVSLAEEILNNSAAAYEPRCFIDVKSEKIGREIHGIPVLSEENATFAALAEYDVQEIVFAVPRMSAENKRKLYEYYKQSGCRIKVYDYPTMRTAGSKRALRDFDIEELLFRKPVNFPEDLAKAYYSGRKVLITGGGGSIGSELCRQIATMSPKQIIILDICENGAYDIQQEIRIAYKNSIDICVEILSVCNRAALERVFANYRPDIVLHAAAHKHVPLMEHNCCEAIENNVFGTLNTVELAEKYKAERFIMVSTDKAVNPTNVMGATKRMCEIIVQSRSAESASTIFSATRFGNVLGSAGSVIPLFKRQIAAGGPITLTDKRIIRYFMTIPEASKLVLQSGAMAKNGELFVLDMGKPVKILELAENMIRLSGFEPYRDIDIVEIGLRPGEKLYEELLIKSETLDKTDDEKIFVERDEPLPPHMLDTLLSDLKAAYESGDETRARDALKNAVPTFVDPEQINAKAEKSEEMQSV